MSLSTPLVLSQKLGRISVRMVRITIWFLAALLAWWWFSTSPAPEEPISDGYESPSVFLERSTNGIGTIVNAPLLERLVPNQTRPNQTIPGEVACCGVYVAWGGKRWHVIVDDDRTRQVRTDENIFVLD